MKTIKTLPKTHALLPQLKKEPKIHAYKFKIVSTNIDILRKSIETLLNIIRNSYVFLNKTRKIRCINIISIMYDIYNHLVIQANNLRC